MNSINSMYMPEVTMEDQSNSHSPLGTDNMSASMMSSQTLNVPAFFPCTASPTTSDSSYLASMLESSSRTSGGSPLLSVSSAGDISPLTGFSVTHRASGSFRTSSFNGSNFGDFLDVGDATTFASHTDTTLATTPVQDFPLFTNMSWHSPGHSSGGVDDIYGSYNGGGSNSRTAADHSPLSDFYTSSQPAWLTPTSTNGDEDTQFSSLSPQILNQRADFDLGSHSPQNEASRGIYFSSDIGLTSWSGASSMDQTTSLQLPPSMKGSKTARFASTVASTKLPQVVTTSHGDTDIDFMSSLQGISGQGSETSLSTTGHRRSTTHGRRSSGKGKDSAGTSSSHEGRRTKSHHSGRRGSGSTEGGSGTTWTKKEFVCQHQFCNSPAFTRMADLERHMKHIHMDADKKERFLCDYSECSRNSTPFHRKDHYREHLREYHLEDLLKRGSNAHRSTSPNTASATASAADYKKTKKLMQEMQLQNCKTDPSWWRCARCLKRVSISERGWTCPSCKGSIEEPRKDIRDLRASGTAGDYTAVSSNVEVTMSSLAAAPAWSHGNFAFEPYK